jgi:poly(3-hydroxybutyrate) depolymerase
VVRHVYSESPAEKAGLQAGDVVTAIGKERIAGRAALVEKLAAMEPGDEVTLTIVRDGQSQTIAIKAGTLPTSIPPALPPARQPRAADANAQRSAVRRFEQKIAEYDNQALVYVHESYDASVPHGVVLHLSADGAYDADKLVALYQPLCDQHDLILVAPQSVAPAGPARRRWDPIRDIAYIGKLLEQLGETYNLDRSRVVVHGYQGGGAMGFLLATRQRDWIRGVAAVDSLPPQKPPENEPQYRLAFYLGYFKQGMTAATRERAVEVLEGMKYPVTLKAVGEESRSLAAEELAELIRWIDTLDRL